MLCTRAGYASTKTKGKNLSKPEEPRIISLCGRCLAPITFSNDHSCSTGNAKDAATTLKESSSPRTLKRLVYEVIKEDLQEGDVKLATGGCPIKIRKMDTVESNASKSQVLTHSHFDDFCLVNNLSINQKNSPKVLQITSIARSKI